MGWKDFFGKKKTSPHEPDPLKDLTLAKLAVGYYVDYDLKTWEVAAYNTYDWGDGDITYEWQLKSADETLYLEREPDDEDFWSVSAKIPLNRLPEGIDRHIIDNGDPPDEIVFEGQTYYLESSGGGHFYKDGRGEGHPLIQWEYEDDEGENYVSIEQWGEKRFEAALGRAVEEYQFTNILPG